jgi:hypothetical protein
LGCAEFLTRTINRCNGEAPTQPPHTPSAGEIRSSPTINMPAAP